MDFFGTLLLILNAVFIGFALVMPVFLLFAIKNNSPDKEEFVANAAKVLIFSGIIYFITTVFLGHNSTYFEGSNVIECFEVLIQPFSYLLLSQILWIKNLRTNKLVLLIISILLLLVPSIWYYTLVTIIHSDYSPGGLQKEAIQVLLLESFLFVIVFIAIVFAVMFTRRVLRKQKN